MNGIENIKNKIMDEAALDAQKITDEAQAEADAILAEADRQMQKEEAALLEKGEKAASLAAERILSAASAGRRSETLRAKQDLLGSVFDRVLGRLEAISGKEYEDLLVRLVCENAEGGEELLFPAADAGIAEQVAKQASAKLGKELKVSKDAAPFTKGVLLRRGRQEVNCSLRVIAEYMKEDLIREAADMLFG